MLRILLLSLAFFVSALHANDFESLKNAYEAHKAKFPGKIFSQLLMLHSRKLRICIEARTAPGGSNIGMEPSAFVVKIAKDGMVVDAKASIKTEVTKCLEEDYIGHSFNVSLNTEAYYYFKNVYVY